jgi:hypothetical protein
MIISKSLSPECLALAGYALLFLFSNAGYGLHIFLAIFDLHQFSPTHTGKHE